MNRLMKGILVGLLLAVGATLLAAPPATMGVGQVRNITFYENVKVGTTVLAPGDYKVTHLVEGETHVLVFKKQGKNSPEVRVNCTMVPLQAKADETQKNFTDVPGGARVLRSLIFAGDTFEHKLAN